MHDLPSLVQHHNTALSEHYKGAGADLNSALQSGMWYNTIANAEQEHIHEPTAVHAHWQGMDNRHRYERNLAAPSTRQQLAQYGWVDSVIDYHINSWGFRSTREYVNITEPCLVTLGCSFTFGTGLHEHQVWSTLVADALGVSLVNLAVPGHGLDFSSLWLVLQGHNITNPVAVCVFEPPRGRISWLSAMNDTVISADTMKDIAGNNIKIMNTLLLNSSANTVKNYHIISNWANQHGVPLLWNNDIPVTTTYARDLAHFGPQWHRSKADAFLKQLKNT